MKQRGAGNRRAVLLTAVTESCFAFFALAVLLCSFLYAQRGSKNDGTDDVYPRKPLFCPNSAPRWSATSDCTQTWPRWTPLLPRCARLMSGFARPIAMRHCSTAARRYWACHPPTTVHCARSLRHLSRTYRWGGLRERGRPHCYGEGQRGSRPVEREMRPRYWGAWLSIHVRFGRYVLRNHVDKMLSVQFYGGLFSDAAGSGN